jgi:hypothetical protein
MARTIWGITLLLGAWTLFGQEALIQELSGTVEVKAPGAAAWSPASRGQRVAPNTLISTGFKSSARIVIGNSTLTIEPLTRLSLEDLVRAGADEKVDINLRAGRVRAAVKPPDGGKTSFTVRSPVATASVRGTSFDFNGLQLQVAEGRVYFTGGDGSGTYVGAGGLARTNPETGQTVGPAETAREALEPPLPPGMDAVSETPAATPATGEIDAGFDWQ